MSAREWESDVCAVAARAEIGDSACAAAVRAEFRRIVDREKRAFDMFVSPNRWCEALIRLRDREIGLLGEAPRAIRRVVFDCLEFRKMVPMRRMSGEELERFKMAALLMKTEEEQNAMLKIITDLQPEAAPEIGQSNVWVDLTRLNYETFDELIKYVKEALRKKGLEYPSGSANN